MEPERRERLLKALPPPAFRALAEEWWWQAHGGQREPPASAGAGPPDWRVWMLIAGRGFGKTRAGAEWVWARARAEPEARIALVAANMEDGARVMVEGDSGILACARTGETARWLRSRGEILFPSGATARVYSGANPAALRGPQHHYAWCDEIAKWRRPEETWHVLAMGLRLGERARTLVTTTPSAMGASGGLLRRIEGTAGTVLTRGRMVENLHLAATFKAEVEAIYGGTRLGRQELDGERLEDVEGALWTRDMIETSRHVGARTREMRRVVVGVDPPASAHGDACGIVVCGVDEGGVGWVLADCSVERARPEKWARAVAAAAEAWDAERVVAEKNNGGDMVESVLRSVDWALPVKLVSASRGKAARAEPVAARFEAGKAKLAGVFPELEDQLAGLTMGGGYLGPGNSRTARTPACGR
jgi:phage terminase large subunit-like protein